MVIGGELEIGHALGEGLNLASSRFAKKGKAIANGRSLQKFPSLSGLEISQDPFLTQAHPARTSAGLESSASKRERSKTTEEAIDKQKEKKKSKKDGL